MSTTVTATKKGRLYDVKDLILPIGFGKYSDCTLLYVLLADRGYYEWLMRDIYAEETKKLQQAVKKLDRQPLKGINLFNYLKANPLEGKRIIGIKTEITDVEDSYLIKDRDKQLSSNEKSNKEEFSRQYQTAVSMIQNGVLGEMISSGMIEINSRKPTMSYGCRKKIYVCKVDEGEIVLTISVFKTGNRSSKSSFNLMYKNGCRSKEIVLQEYRSLHMFFERYCKEAGQKKDHILSPNRTRKKVSVNTDACIIKSSNFQCEKYHAVEDVIAVFSVVNKRGEIVTVEKSAGFCHECGEFYIKPEEFSSVLKIGIVLCRVIKVSNTGGKAQDQYGLALSDHSPLSDAGYTVRQSVGLSTEQRRAILENLVDHSIISKQGIVSYLDLFIFRGSNKKNMQNAVEKWEADKAYIRKYHMRSDRRKRVHLIVNKSLIHL